MSVGYLTVTFWYCWHLTKLCVLHAAADVGLTVPQLIVQAGYPVETFANVTTADKYLLDVFRIPHGRYDMERRNSRPAVLLMHGYLGTSRSFLILGPERALPFLLADRGYDVWLGNSRGSRYSRKHLVLDPDVDKDYWEFSWHEVGVYDLPATFDLIKKVTNQEQISYIGISQGTTIFYVLMSERPDYNSFINIMVSMGPLVYTRHLNNPAARLLARYEPFLANLAKSIGLSEILPQSLNRLLVSVNEALCREDSVVIQLCATIFSLIGGFNFVEFNGSILHSVVSDGSGGGSVRQLAHYAQILNYGDFRKFNFGPTVNLQKYGYIKPPLYNLSKVESPVAIFHAEQDWQAQPEDVNRLCRNTPNCVYKYKVPYPLFTHLDFVFSNSAVELVYKHIFRIMKVYNKNVS